MRSNHDELINDVLGKIRSERAVTFSGMRSEWTELLTELRTERKQRGSQLGSGEEELASIIAQLRSAVDAPPPTGAHLKVGGQAEAPERRLSVAEKVDAFQNRKSKTTVADSIDSFQNRRSKTTVASELPATATSPTMTLALPRAQADDADDDDDQKLPDWWWTMRNEWTELLTNDRAETLAGVQSQISQLRATLQTSAAKVDAATHSAKASVSHPVASPPADSATAAQWWPAFRAECAELLASIKAEREAFSASDIARAQARTVRFVTEEVGMAAEKDHSMLPVRSLQSAVSWADREKSRTNSMASFVSMPPPSSPSQASMQSAAFGRSAWGRSRTWTIPADAEGGAACIGKDRLASCIESTKQAVARVEAVVHCFQDNLISAADPMDEDFQREWCEEMLGSARSTLHDLASAMGSARAAVAAFVKQIVPTTRRGYLRPLEELAGPVPVGKDWRREEIPAMLAEECQHRNENYAELQDEFSLEGFVQKATKHGFKYVAGYASQMQISEEDAKILALIFHGDYYAGPLSRALREASPRYAGTTHYLVNLLSNQLISNKGPPLKNLYRNLRGKRSLVDDDPMWEKLEEMDAAGAQGLVMNSIVKAGCGWANLDKQCGYAPGPDFDPVDSDVVCFQVAPSSVQGTLHGPIMTTKAAGVFPPNTLFQLKEILPAPFEARDVDGRVHRINQRCLVVLVTHRPPSPNVINHQSSSKLMGCVAALLFGSRDAYTQGVQEVIAKPLLNMEQEFQRDFEWEDWKGLKHTLQDKWNYVSGPAERHDNCALGIRDEGHNGFYPETFQSMINKHIQSRREKGCGLELAAEYAILTISEVKAVRLFTGPAHHPINRFLQQVATLHSAFRNALCQSVELTFAATVGHLCHAIRKISAVATPEELQKPLYRGARGTMPQLFWKSTQCAIDAAFMSASRHREQVVSSMGNGDNVLWEMVPEAKESSSIEITRGADVSILSQYASEGEVLFPPYTLLLAKIRRGQTSSHIEAKEFVEGGKTFISIKTTVHCE